MNTYSLSQIQEFEEKVQSLYAGYPCARWDVTLRGNTKSDPAPVCDGSQSLMPGPGLVWGPFLGRDKEGFYPESQRERGSADNSSL